MKLLLIIIIYYVYASETGTIKKYDFQNDGSGNYSFDVETVNFKHKQEGYLEKKAGNLKVVGSYSYKINENLRLNVEYTADELGYRPKTTWIFIPAGHRPPGGASGGKRISSTVLATLVGGGK